MMKITYTQYPTFHHKLADNATSATPPLKKNVSIHSFRQLYISLPEIGDYTDPEIFGNKKIRTPEKCSKSFGNAVSAIFP